LFVLTTRARTNLSERPDANEHTDDDE